MSSEPKVYRAVDTQIIQELDIKVGDVFMGIGQEVSPWPARVVSVSLHGFTIEIGVDWQVFDVGFQEIYSLLQDEQVIKLSPNEAKLARLLHFYE